MNCNELNAVVDIVRVSANSPSTGVELTAELNKLRTNHKEVSDKFFNDTVSYVVANKSSVYTPPTVEVKRDGIETIEKIFQAKGLTKAQNLIALLGHKKMLELHDSFMKVLVPKLMFDTTQNNPFVDFTNSNEIKRKIGDFRKEISGGAKPLDAAGNDILDKKITESITSQKPIEEQYVGNVVDNMFDELLEMFVSDLVVKVVDEKAKTFEYKLKITAKLSNVLFTSDDTIADGLDKLPSLVKLFLGSQKDNAGHYHNFTNVLKQFTLLNEHPLYHRLIANFSVETLNQIIDTSLDKSTSLPILGYNEEQQKAIDKHYRKYKNKVEKNEKFKEVVTFLKDFLFAPNQGNNKTLGYSIQNFDTITSGTIANKPVVKKAYQDLFATIVSGLISVTDQKYSQIEFDGDREQMVVKNSTEYDDSYEMDLTRTLIQTNKYLIDNPILSGIFVAMKERLSSTSPGTEREMLADLGMMVDKDFIQDMYADSGMITAEQVAYKEKLRKEVLEIVENLPLKESKHSFTFNNSEGSKAMQKALTYKKKIDMQTPSSVTMNSSGDPVSNFGLASEFKRFQAVIHKTIDKGFHIFNGNPLVNGSIPIEGLIIGGGVNNGKDITPYAKLSEESQYNYMTMFHYWGNLIYNKNIELLSFEMSDKSTNQFFSIDTFTNDTSAFGEKRNLFNYEIVDNNIYESQKSYYDNVVKSMIYNFGELVKHSQTMPVKLPPIIGTDVNVVTEWFVKVNAIGGVKLLGQISSDYLLKTGVNIPIMKELMYEGNPVNLSLKSDFLYEIELLKDEKQYNKRQKLRLLKDAYYMTYKNMQLSEVNKFLLDDDSNKDLNIKDQIKDVFNVGKKPNNGNGFNKNNNRNPLSDTTSAEYNELLKMIMTNKNLNEIPTELIDSMFNKINPLIVKAQKDWELVSINAQQLTQGNIFQYKGGNTASMWLASTKRNVFIGGGGQALVLGTPTGLEQESFVAVVQDPKEFILNVLADEKLQENEDGSRIITEEVLEKLRIACGGDLGNEIGDIIKDICKGQDYTFGVAQLDKTASHVSSGEKARASLRQMNRLKKQYKAISFIDTELVEIPPHKYAVKKVVDGKIAYDILEGESGKFPANNLYDVRSLFGSKAELGFDVVVEDINGDMFDSKTGKNYRYANSRDNQSVTRIVINQIEPNYLNPKNKGRYLGEIVYESTRKSGVANLNTSDIQDDANPFAISTQSNEGRMIQLNAWHKIDDHSLITVASQITGGATFNAHIDKNKHNADKIYNSYNELIQYSLETEFPDLTKIEALTHEDLNFLRQLIKDKLSVVDTTDITQQILDKFENDDEGFRKILAGQITGKKIKDSLNAKMSDSIQFKLNGFQAVMGVNFSEIYRLPKLKFETKKEKITIENSIVKELDNNNLETDKVDAIVSYSNDLIKIKENLATKGYELLNKSYYADGRVFHLVKLPNGEVISVYETSKQTSGKETGFHFIFGATDDWYIKGTSEQMLNSYQSSVLKDINSVFKSIRNTSGTFKNYNFFKQLDGTTNSNEINLVKNAINELTGQTSISREEFNSLLNVNPTNTLTSTPKTNEATDIINAKLNVLNAVSDEQFTNSIAKLTSGYKETGEEVVMTYSEFKAWETEYVKAGIDTTQRKSKLNAGRFDIQTVNDENISVFQLEDLIKLNYFKTVKSVLEDINNPKKADKLEKNQKVLADLQRRNDWFSEIEITNYKYLIDKTIVNQEAKYQLVLNNIEKGKAKFKYSNMSLYDIYGGNTNSRNFDFSQLEMFENESKSYTSKPAEMIAPFKWAKQFGIKKGMSINDVDEQFFINQMVALSQSTKDEDKAQYAKLIEKHGNDLNLIAKLKMQSFKNSLLTIVGRINKYLVL